MKIFSAAQIREWDQFTIANEPVTSLELMERAAQKCLEWLTRFEIDDHPIKIFCGKGNNGGDGLAIARLLAEQGIFSRIYILEFALAGTEDFQANLHRLHQFTTDINYIQDESFLPVIKKEDVVIDALFGSGINRPLEGLAALLVKHINNANALVVSIDVPSGMLMDSSSINHSIIKANHTLTFQIPKLPFLLPENEDFVGEMHILDIGLHPQFSTEIETPFTFIDLPLIRSFYKKRKTFSHKGTYGHALTVTGSKGKMGAAHLCAKACLRSGVGLLSCLVPEIGLEIMQTSLPEAMCFTDNEVDSINWKSYSSVGIGPGLGTTNEAIEQVIKVLRSCDKPMVVDADALNILSQNKNLLSLIPAESVLTPHPKEYERLFGKTTDDFERLQSALSNAKQLNVYIILKGHYTFIACPDGEGYFNSTGNPGMATGGSGDVLTGILTGLLSQQYTPKEACLLGVYIHGLSGDFAAAELSEEAMLAGDIINHLGKAFIQISNIA